jgi:hypothetical protein
MKTPIKIILIIVALGFIGMILGYFFYYNKSHPDFENLKPDHKLSASELYQSFKEKEDESGKKYNGKIIEINGAFTKVESKDSLVIVVFVFNQGMFGDEGIRCTMLRKFNNEALNLQQGQACSLKGYCTGYNDPDVILEQCSILK